MKPTKKVATMENETLEVKKCKYKDCENTIPYNNDFDYCEVCRLLSIRNTLAVVQDPSTPILTERIDLIHSALFHNMRPEEKLNLTHHVEYLYLALKKELASRELTEYRSTKFKEALDEVNSERNKPRAPKTVSREKRREVRSTDKVAKLFGGDRDAARRILGKVDVSDL